MLWFQRLFPPALILTGVIFTHLVRRRPGQQLPLERVLLLRLWLATLAFVALHVIVQSVLEATQPPGSALRAGWPTLIAVLGCVTVWTRFAAPALAAREPGYRPLAGAPASSGVDVEPGASATDGPAHAAVPSGPSERSASLLARQEPVEISARAWTLGWSTFGLAAVATLWAIAEGAPIAMLLGLGWWIGMAFFGSRATRLEPEPMDPAGSPELAATYSHNRAFRSWVFFALGLSGTVAYACIAIALLAWPAASGMIGAVIGSSLGIAGATFGVVASIQRARAQALLHELSEAG